MPVDLTDYGITFRAPVLPRPPDEYSRQDFEKLNNSEFDSDGNKIEVSYPFHTDNVEEFAEFCLNSGGFRIH